MSLAAAADAGVRGRGFALAAAGVAVLSLDALLIRLIDAPPATVGLWRGVLQAASLIALRLALGGRFRWPAAPGLTLLAACLLAGSALGFIAAITHAPVATVLLIVSLAPLSGALIAWIALGERVARATWIAIAVALSGLALALGGGAQTGHDIAPPPFPGFGEAMALVAVLSIGGYFTILRAPRAPADDDAIILGGVVMAAACALVATDATLPANSIPYALALGGLVIPLSFSLISAGARLLPSAETGLVLLLETVLGVLWVWLVLAEAPDARMLAGGAIVLAAVGGRVVALSRRSRPS